MSQGFNNDELTKTCVGTLPKSWGGLFKMVFLFKGLVQLQMKYMAQEKMIPTMDVFFSIQLV